MPLYLDHNATTSPDPQVLESMLAWLGDKHANPHADHVAGRTAADAVERARGAVSELIGADAEDIFFTSGATESNNLILQGLLNHGTGSRRLFISAIEHKSILAIGGGLAETGVSVKLLQVDSDGRITARYVAESIGTEVSTTTVVAVMHASNEIGTIQPVAEIAKALEDSGAIFHVDAAQTCGKVPIDVHAQGIDCLSISSHKLYGPAGVGAVYISPRVRRRLRPLMFGGGQQDSVRPGTVPVFLVVGLGVASELASRQLTQDATHLTACATACIARLTELNVNYRLLGDSNNRLPGLVSVRLPGVDADSALRFLGRELYASTGSACTSGEIRVSHVYRAIGLTEEEGSEVVRLGFGRHSTVDNAVHAAELLSYATRKLRE